MGVAENGLVMIFYFVVFILSIFPFHFLLCSVFILVGDEFYLFLSIYQIVKLNVNVCSCSCLCLIFDQS